MERCRILVADPTEAPVTLISFFFLGRMHSRMHRILVADPTKAP